LIVCVIGVDQINNQRGNVFVSQITGILRQLSPSAKKEDIKRMLLPVIVRYAGSYPVKIKRSIQTVIDSIKSKYILCDPEFINIFMEPKFPQLNEVS
jgi:hypothetical protein